MLPYSTENSGTLFKLRLEPDIIHSVFPTWRDRLLSINHWLHDANSVPSLLEMELGSLLLTTNTLSSTYNSNLQVTDISMSFE